MMAEWAARLGILAILLGLPLGIFMARGSQRSNAVEVHAAMPEAGGWMPDALEARVGEPLVVRLTSDDVIHGFALGQRDEPSVDIEPGKFTELTLVFDQPGAYTFYCTRWCGPNHWRMRGTIEVTGHGVDFAPAPQPLYFRLGIDLDAPITTTLKPIHTPSAARGAALDIVLPPEYLAPETYLHHSPVAVWRSLRQESRLSTLSDQEIWDLVTRIWQANAAELPVELGQTLYAENCAACHGETGAGDGVMAAQATNPGWMPAGEHAGVLGHEIIAPPDFTAESPLLGASPARLQGKIIRGGMGTGMPYWGPIFTEEQTWALVDYLWSFQFQYDLSVERGSTGRLNGND